ncbi:uncharacterized protein LOC126742972 [Anthonomus grandis grandis]|uniref:uncharacterized protein LOC126742972 n=1 Tax=Anthonomus grandis grandis TaxID=2921223 RepID=UPI002165E002|nr:uncharacterized protein LOC126742972 [Anthonomus grandis grandis]
MKSVICVLVVVVAVVTANQIQEKWNRVHQGCQQNQALYVPDIIFEQLKRGEKPNLPANFGLHANCMMVDLGYQDSQGQAITGAIREITKKYYSDNGKVEDIVRECSNQHGNKEQVALGLFSCFGKHKINIGQF